MNSLPARQIGMAKNVAKRTRIRSVRIPDHGFGRDKSAYGGGRQYWANSLQSLNVIDTPDRRLRFAGSGSTTSATATTPAAVASSNSAPTPKEAR